MHEETLFAIPHIRLLRLESGELCLLVEDTELNDFVEDFLCERFGYVASSVVYPEGAGSYRSFFQDGPPAEQLSAALEQIDAREAARIFSLNN